MERCPNCGSSVKSGAKFCTTCGMRLPAEEPTAASRDTRSPFDTTASLSSSRWPTPPGTATDVSAAASGYAVAGSTSSAAVGGQPTPASSPSNATDQTVEPDVAPTPTGESTVTWSRPGSSFDWNWGESTDTSDPNEAQTVADELVATGENDEISSKTVETETTVSESADSSDIAVEETIGGTVIDAFTSDVTDVDAGVSQLAAPSETLHDVSSTEQTSTYKPVAAVQPNDAPDADAASSEMLDRANDLLDELRDLLPQLHTVKALPNLGVAIDHLESARVSSNDLETFASLREAVRVARERPRDIDTMLDIVSRLDAIARLEEAYTTLRDAVDVVTPLLKEME